MVFPKGKRTAHTPPVRVRPKLKELVQVSFVDADGFTVTEEMTEDQAEAIPPSRRR